MSSGIRWAVKAPSLLGRGIGAGQHAEHAGRGLRLRGIDAPDARMRVRRMTSDAVALVRQVDVVDIATAAGEEALVLDPAHRLTDSEFGHVSPHSLCWLEGEPSVRIGLGSTRQIRPRSLGSGMRSSQFPRRGVAARIGPL